MTAKSQRRKGSEPSGIIDNLVQQHWASLSRLQRTCAQFLVDEPNIVAVSSAGSLGRRLGLSTSTVVRTAMALGFSGFPTLQQAMQEELFARTDLVQRLASTERDAVGHPVEAVRTSFKADVAALQQVMAALPASSFEQAIELLTRSRRIYVAALGLSHAAAHILVVGLQEMGLDARPAVSAINDIALEMHGAAREDLMVAIAMPRYPRRTIAALDYARTRKVPAMAITDSPISPLAARADPVLYARPTNVRFFESIVPAVSVVNALLTGVAIAAGKQARRSIELLESEWHDSQAFYRDPDAGD